MYSTLRILTKHKNISVDLLSKVGNNCSFHAWTNRCTVSTNRLSVLLKRKELGFSSLNSFKFQSTASSNVDNVKADHLISTETIPEPPTPLVEPTLAEQVLPKDKIPDPPEIPGVDPTFESLGLGGWSPIGIVQNCLEYIHITCDLPWWGTIMVGTVIVRTLLFPLVIINQRNNAKMVNHLPEMQEIQVRMTDARQRGDRLDSARHAQDMMLFMKEKDINPIKNMIIPIAQAPLFISFFMGLREMANLPVESMKNGGILWFTDLSLTDQFYILPIITSLTLFVTIELGVDSGKLDQSPLMKYVMRSIPVIIFPFTMGFPSAILLYWASTNLFSLLQVSLLRIPRVRTIFNIPQLVKYDKKKLPIKNKGFVGGMKDSWTNMKITRELDDRIRVDEMNFKRAGRGAIVKTYKFDPTRTHLQNIAPVIQAKKRD